MSNANATLVFSSFNFVKLVFFSSNHSSHCSHFFKCCICFHYCFQSLLSLKWEKQSATKLWTLNISCWYKKSLFYKSSMKNFRKKMNLPIDKKKCVGYFNIVAWYMLLLLFLSCLHKKQALYWYLVFFLTFY